MIEQIELDRIQAACRVMMEDLPGVGHDVQVWHDLMLESAVAQLRVFVLGKEMEPLHYQWPATWWEALKERWFPRWAKERWPVEYEHRDVTFRELYPDFKPALPQGAGIPAKFRLVIQHDEYAHQGPSRFDAKDYCDHCGREEDECVCED